MESKIAKIVRYIRETGIKCFHFDSKVQAAEARRLAGDTLALMGVQAISMLSETIRQTWW
jgi:hypothetical protein